MLSELTLNTAEPTEPVLVVGLQLLPDRTACNTTKRIAYITKRVKKWIHDLKKKKQRDIQLHVAFTVIFPTNLCLSPLLPCCASITRCNEPLPSDLNISELVFQTSANSFC